MNASIAYLGLDCFLYRRSNASMNVICQCCGFAREFSDADDAFESGWDAPPYFTHVTCHLCPPICLITGTSHAKAHAYWAQTGRPRLFTLATCGTDEHFGRVREFQLCGMVTTIR